MRRSCDWGLQRTWLREFAQLVLFDPIKNKPRLLDYTTTQQRTTLVYDTGGFLSQRKGEHGQALTYHYNANGDVDQIKDALNNTTTYSYDRQRRVTSTTDAAGTTQLTYNALGLTTQVRDARNNATSYSYDGLGNLLAQTSPDTGSTSFSYNAVGQRTQQQRADGSTLAYTYDALGRLKTQAGGGQTRTLTYDSCGNGKGQLCSAAKTGGTATTANFSYTAWGQLATRQDVLGAATDTTSYSYDGMGRLAGIGYPSGISAGYSYTQGRLDKITATVNGATSTVASFDGYRVFSACRPTPRAVCTLAVVRRRRAGGRSAWRQRPSGRCDRRFPVRRRLRPSGVRPPAALRL